MPYMVGFGSKPYKLKL